MKGNDGGNGDRGQAFTLEGFIASVVVLTAILFALQSIVITPTTSGTVDQNVQSQLRTQAHDILVASAHNGTHNLSYWVRYWNGTEGGPYNNRTWAYAVDETVGFGPNEPFHPVDSAFGEMLNQTFKQRGRVYNVIVEYRNGTQHNKSEELNLVYRGVPSDNAIVTTYTLVLFDNQTLTGPGANQSLTLEWYDTNPTDGTDGYFPIPDAYDKDPEDAAVGKWQLPPGALNDSGIYNVVEIRVVVW